MALHKLALVPEQDSFSGEGGKEVVSAILEGGASRYRKDQLGSTWIGTVSWNLGPTDFDYFVAFFNVVGKAGLAFSLDLIWDDHTLQTYTAHFVEGSYKLAVNGQTFKVSAKLEIMPRTRDSAADLLSVLAKDPFFPYGIAAGTADSLVVSLAGNAYQATVAPGTYATGADLAAAIQAALTAAAANSWSCTYNASGRFVISGSSSFLLRAITGRNVMTYSQQLDAAVWTVYAGGASVQADNAAAPDATMTADTLTFPPATEVRAQPPNLSSLAGETWTISIWLKGTAGETMTVFLYGYDPVHWEQIGGGYGYPVTMTGAWQRVVYTGTFAYSHAWLQFCLARFSGNTANVVQAWGAQLERGHVGLYVPTTSVAAVGTDCSALLLDLGWTGETTWGTSTTAPNAPILHRNKP